MDSLPAQKPGWLARIVLGLMSIALVIVGFFFFTVALVAGALIALVVGLRLWWMFRKLKRAHAGQGAPGPGVQRDQAGSDGALDGEYQVVERDTNAPRLPPTQQP